MGIQTVARQASLVPFEHKCSDLANCGGKILLSSGNIGIVQKLLLTIPETHFSRFMDSVDQAIEWAAKHNVTIPKEDIDKCRSLGL